MTLDTIKIINNPLSSKLHDMYVGYVISLLVIEKIGDRAIYLYTDSQIANWKVAEIIDSNIGLPTSIYKNIITIIKKVWKD